MSDATLNDVLDDCAEKYQTAELNVVANADGSWTATLAGNTMAHGHSLSATGEHVHMALALLVEAYCDEEGL